MSKMKVFEITGTQTVRFSHFIEAESLDKAWDAVQNLTGDDIMSDEIVETEDDIDVDDVSEVKDDEIMEAPENAND